MFPFGYWVSRTERTISTASDSLSTDASRELKKESHSKIVQLSRPPSGRRVAPMKVRLVEGHPEEVVGDGFGHPLVEAGDPDPLVLVALLLVGQIDIDGASALVAEQMGGQGPLVVPYPSHEIEVPPVVEGKDGGQLLALGLGGPGRPLPVGPEKVLGRLPVPEVALDESLGHEPVPAVLDLPGKIVDEPHLGVGRPPDPADNGLLVQSGPFQGEGVLLLGRLDQDGRILGLIGRQEGQAEVELHPGVLAVRRLGTDLGNEVEQGVLVGDLAVLLHRQAEGEHVVLGRGEDEPAPGRSVEGADERAPPGVIDLGEEGGSRQENERPGQDQECTELLHRCRLGTVPGRRDPGPAKNINQRPGECKGVFRSGAGTTAGGPSGIRTVSAVRKRG
jgi:hypothetical protein